MDLSNCNFFHVGEELSFSIFSDSPCRARYINSISTPLTDTKHMDELQWPNQQLSAEAQVKTSNVEEEGNSYSILRFQSLRKCLSVWRTT